MPTPDLSQLTSEQLLGATGVRSDDLQDRFYGACVRSSLLAGNPFTGSPFGKVLLKGNWNLATAGSGDYLWVFAKTLEHDPTTMLPKRSQCDRLLDYFVEPTFDKLATLPKSTVAERKLEDPTGGLGFEPIGEHQTLIAAPHHIQIDSPEGVMEMTEVYCMAIMRDTLISSLNAATDPTTITTAPRDGNGVAPESAVHESADAILSILNTYTSSTRVKPNWPVDPQTGTTNLALMFRGHGKGEDIGQYVSQLLILDIPFGSGIFEQKYAPEWDSVASVTKVGYVAIQNGVKLVPTKAAIPARRIRSLRDIGSVVHSDPAYGLYFNAGLIAAKAGLDALKEPGAGSNFMDTGVPDYLTCIGAVTRAALRAAWLTKWQNSLKIRPETTAARLSWYETATDKPPELAVWAEMFSDDLKTRIKAWTASQGADEGSTFLPLLYDEGSPTHPSFPAGHATVAGACVTIIKAFLHTHGPAPAYAPVKWTAKFGPMQMVSDDTGDLMDTVDSGETIVGELNKLASNVSLGRNMAGVHYRYDGDCGILMGEEVAISYLKAMTCSYYPAILKKNISFLLEKFDGTLVTIAHGECNPIT